MTKTLCLGPHLDPGQDSGIRQPDPARDPGRDAGAGCDSGSGTRTEERAPAFGSGVETRAGKRAPNLDPIRVRLCAPKRGHSTIHLSQPPSKE